MEELHKQLADDLLDNLNKEIQSHNAEINRICKALDMPQGSTIEDIVKEIKQLKQLGYLLGEAAREINCAGPVAHRIRVLKKEWSEYIDKLEKENQKLRANQRLGA